MLKKIERAKASKGYLVLMKVLEEYFGKDFIVRGFICNTDPTSFDFRMILDLPKLIGIDIGVGQSGPSQMFRLGGNGFIGISIPKSDATGILYNGVRGTGLGWILKNDRLTWGAPVDSPESIKNYFDLFQSYYEEHYLNPVDKHNNTNYSSQRTDNTYFNMGNDGWLGVVEQLKASGLKSPTLINAQMWQINQNFLDKQIAKNKAFEYGQDPKTLPKSSFYFQEYLYLLDHGYQFHESNGVWTSREAVK